MLIHVDGSGTADVISGSATAPRSHDAIEHLLSAHCEGSHVISIRREDTQGLLVAQIEWSRGARRALQHIHENHPLIAGLRHDVPWSMELGIGPGFDGHAHDLDDGRKVIRAPLAAFDRRQNTACAALLGEHRNDANLFVQLGLLMRAHRRWDALEMNHEPHLGGGDTTGIVFRGLADQGRVVLGMGDTDQRHPRSGEGGTYRKLTEAAQGRPAYQRARALHVRTAEGLIPLSVYREVLTSPERLTSVDRNDQLLRSAPADILRYAPLKDGIRLHQIENPKTPEEGEYWATIATSVGRDRCNQPSRQHCTKREECKCYVVDALGANALADVVTWMQGRKSKRDLAKRFQLRDGHALSALADEILSFGLALPPVRT